MPESLFDKVAGPRFANLFKKRLKHSCFPLNLSKFLRTAILQNIRERLLLIILKLLPCVHDIKVQVDV